MDADFARYHRQMLLPAVGSAGQARLHAATALVVGCGALGSTLADQLARAGVGRLKLVDRDFVELTNLQRQTLYTEADVAAGVPKAEAARLRLTQVNSAITIEAHIADVNAASIADLGGDVDVIVDGLDNFETRFVINDFAVQRGIPYVYGGAVATHGMTVAVLPRSAEGTAAWEQQGGATPCLRCLFDAPPPAGSAATCDTAGVLGPAVAVIGSVQAAEALKILLGEYAAVRRSLLTIDLWDNALRQVDVGGALRADCPCCGRRQFEFLAGQAVSRTTTLCGRNTVQLLPGRAGEAVAGGVDFEQLAQRLAAHGPVQRNAFLLRASITERGQTYQLTIFRDGRALVQGTDDPTLARAVYARYVGA